MKNKIHVRKTIKRFELTASAFSNNLIKILESKNDIGGCYKNIITLPKEINISNKNINIYFILYRIIFSISISKKRLYSKSIKNNLDFLMILSLITVKNINKDIHKKYKITKKIIKKLYPLLNKERISIEKLSGRPLLIEIIIKKFTYEKIKKNIKISENAKIWIFKIENILNINNKNLTTKAEDIYNSLCKIEQRYQDVKLYPLWGYLYKEKNNKNFKIIKNNLIKKENKKLKTKTNKTVFYLKKENKKNTQSLLIPIFDYKKTYEEKNKYNKTQDDNNAVNTNKNLTSYQSDENKISQIMKSYIINKINKDFINKKNKINKIRYKEWDYKKNIYKNSWCHLFIKKTEIRKYKYDDIKQNAKKDILLFKKYLKIIINKNIYKNAQKYGDYIDIDSITDNYKCVLENKFEKTFIIKKKIKDDIALILLLDSSMSTESKINNIDTLNNIKYITNIISEGIKNLITTYKIASFYSNTRYDCRFTIIKDFKEKWEDKKYSLNNIIPTGYTRIGPAIRHSIEIIKKLKIKKKIIILLSDGNPTDYDEYEGLYGINDIKKSIKEAKKLKIITLCILVNSNNKTFEKIFDKKNYCKIKTNNRISKQLSNFFNLAINEN